MNRICAVKHHIFSYFASGHDGMPEKDCSGSFDPKQRTIQQPAAGGAFQHH